jgi:hypothetical protein
MRMLFNTRRAVRRFGRVVLVSRGIVLGHAGECRMVLGSNKDRSDMVFIRVVIFVLCGRSCGPTWGVVY